MYTRRRIDTKSLSRDINATWKFTIGERIYLLCIIIFLFTVQLAVYTHVYTRGWTADKSIGVKRDECIEELD